ASCSASARTTSRASSDARRSSSRACRSCACRRSGPPARAPRSSGRSPSAASRSSPSSSTRCSRISSARPPRSAPRWAGAAGRRGGGGGGRGVPPPHLQLAGSVLYEHLGAGEATLTLAHYRHLGGFDTIVGRHLERVLDTDLADGRDVIARDLFVAL